MILYSRDLPSGGNLGGESSYQIEPLTFIELYKQRMGPELSPLRSYIRDLKLLVTKDENIKKAPLLDADYLVFLLKMLTINEKMKFTNRMKCPHCGKEIRLVHESPDVKVITMEESVIEINLGGMMRKVKMPTIEEFLLFCDRLPPFADDWGLDLVKLYSLFYDYKIQPPIGMATQLVDNAVWSEITGLMTVEDRMLNPFKPIHKECPECKGGITIEALSSVADMFRHVLRSNPLDQNKIRLKQIRKTGESGAV